MPSASGDGGRRVELRVTDEFVSSLATVTSPRVLERIRRVLEDLRSFPDMGSTDVRPCLARRYGEGLRKISVASLVIVYRHTADAVEVLALVWGPTIV